ncbi:MAG: hypothetical protein NXH91_17150 [Phyllobacteriaceae bacterium]|nr:hypothetical protein [Phyllobacteriaceae bacterium]
MNLLEGCEVDQAVMLAFSQADAPIRRFDIARIDGALQKLGNALVADFAVWQVFREGGLPLKEALHFHLRFEAA